MPESFPISIISIQGMSGLWGSKRAYKQLGQPFFSLQIQPCRHTIEQVHRFFNRALSAIFCGHDLIFSAKMRNIRNYGVSNLTIYYVPPRTYAIWCLNLVHILLCRFHA